MGQGRGELDEERSSGKKSRGSWAGELLGEEALRSTASLPHQEAVRKPSQCSQTIIE